MSKRIRQLIILAISVIFIGVFIALIIAVIPERPGPDPPGTIDPPENGEEEIELPYVDLEVVRTEHVRRNPTTIDLVAEIKNPNVEWGVREFQYTFRIPNLLGVEQDTLTGTSYILPGETKYIVVTSVSAGYQVGELKFDIEEEHWSITHDFARLNLDIEHLRFVEADNLPGEPLRLSAHVVNNSVFALTDIRVVGLLFGKNNDIIGANRTSIQRVLEGETREVEMFWKSEEISSDDASRYEVVAYSNILRNENFIRRYRVTDGGTVVDPGRDPSSYFQLPEIFRRVRSWW